MSDDKTSLINTRTECWNLIKKEGDEFITYAGTVNRMCESFELKEFTPDQRCLNAPFFVQDLTANEDTEIRVGILSKLEQVG